MKQVLLLTLALFSSGAMAETYVCKTYEGECTYYCPNDYGGCTFTRGQTGCLSSFRVRGMHPMSSVPRGYIANTRDLPNVLCQGWGKRDDDSNYDYDSVGHQYRKIFRRRR